MIFMFCIRSGADSARAVAEKQSSTTKHCKVNLVFTPGSPRFSPGGNQVFCLVKTRCRNPGQNSDPPEIQNS